MITLTLQGNNVIITDAMPSLSQDRHAVTVSFRQVNSSYCLVQSCASLYNSKQTIHTYM